MRSILDWFAFDGNMICFLRFCIRGSLALCLLQERFLSAGYIPVKTAAFQVLCIATASRGQKHQHTEIQAHSTLSVFRGYSVDKSPFGPPVEPLSLTIACETSNFLRFCIPVLTGCSYINRAVRFDGPVSMATAANLHTDPSAKGGTL